MTVSVLGLKQDALYALQLLKWNCPQNWKRSLSRAVCVALHRRAVQRWTRAPQPARPFLRRHWFRRGFSHLNGGSRPQAWSQRVALVLWLQPFLLASAHLRWCRHSFCGRTRRFRRSSYSKDPGLELGSAGALVAVDVRRRAPVPAQRLSALN